MIVISPYMPKFKIIAPVGASRHMDEISLWRGFWATVCKTVRPMLSDRCLSCLPCLSVCLSVLSVTLVYCGQTVGWIKMKLGAQVGLGPGHIVLDGDSAISPPPKRHSLPIFAPYLLLSNCWMD